MPRNNGKAAVATKEPDDLYDHLEQPLKDTWDRIGSLGYTPDRNGLTSLWFAHKTNDKDAASIGPCETLAALLDRVREEIAEDAEFDNDIDSSGDGDESVFSGRNEEQFPTRGEGEESSEGSEESTPGDGYLFPGMKPTAQRSVPDLVTAILNYESYKRERQDALTKEVEAKEKVVGLMRANKDALAFDPKTGIRSYRVNDYIEELVPGEEKLKSRRVSEDED
jgi:hypothetical protein